MLMSGRTLWRAPGDLRGAAVAEVMGRAGYVAYGTGSANGPAYMRGPSLKRAVFFAACGTMHTCPCSTSIRLAATRSRNGGSPRSFPASCLPTRPSSSAGTPG